MSTSEDSARTALEARRASRILVVLLGAIGDVVRAMPLALRVRRALPDAWITWAVEPAAAPLLERHPAIDESLVFRRDRGARAFFAFLGEVRRRRFDLTLDLQRHLKSGIVSLASRAPVRVGFDRSNSKEGNWLFNTESIAPQNHWSSKLRQYLAFADHLALGDQPIDFGFGLDHEEEQHVESLLRGVSDPFVAAFVGSTWGSRWWFPERTAEVLRRLRTGFGLSAVLVGAGDAEQRFAAEVTRAAPEGVLDLSGRTRLRDLIGIFARARVAFGPDSGPMHIAAAVGTPVVSLWGSTSPRRSAPFGSEDLALVGQVACQSCYLRHCPVGRLCMKEIAVGAVVKTIETALGRRAA